MAWNRPDNVSTKPRETRSPLSLLWVKGVAAGVVCIICGTLAVVWLMKREVSQETEKPRKDNSPVEVKPMKVEPKAELPKKEVPVLVKPAPAAPVRNVIMAKTAKAGQVMTLMDGTVITNVVKRPFEHDLEHALWVSLRPGNMGASLLSTLQFRHTDAEIMKMLKEKTVLEEGDSEGLIRIKGEVQALKERILAAVASGRTLSDVLSEIRNQGVQESMVKAQTMRIRAEAIRSGDPEMVRDAVDAANAIRAKNGLEPMEVPENFKEKAPANKAFTEFD